MYIFYNINFLSCFQILEHGKNVHNIHQHLSPEILPKSLGGSLAFEEAIDQDFIYRVMDKNEYYKGKGQPEIILNAFCAERRIT